MANTAVIRAEFWIRELRRGYPFDDKPQLYAVATHVRRRIVPTGKLSWQMNPNVRGSLEFVARLKEFAHTYHSTSDPQIRGRAQRGWDAALSKLFDTDMV